MKKILIVLNIFLCYFLFGCNTSVNSSIYISSMGFEVIDGQLVTYFLSNPLADISRNKDEKDNNNQYVKVESKSIFEAFRDAEKSLLSPLNFRHIKTAILSKEFIESKYLEEFLIYLKSVRIISYNFYVFSTISKIEDIYKFSNPEQISYQYSLLSSPDLLDYRSYGVEKVHFLDFANDYYNKNRYLHIPLIVTNKNWLDKITLQVDGYLCLNDNVNLYQTTVYEGMLYLYSHNSILFHDDEDVYRISNYKIEKTYQDNTFNLRIQYDDLIIFGNGSRKEFEEKLVLKIKKYLDDYIQNQNGLYLIEFYNYLNKESLNVYNYEIKFVHNK